MPLTFPVLSDEPAATPALVISSAPATAAIRTASRVDRGWQCARESPAVHSSGAAPADRRRAWNTGCSGYAPTLKAMLWTTSAPDVLSVTLTSRR